MRCFVEHIGIDKKHLHSPHPDGPPPFSLLHPPVNVETISDLVSNVNSIHTIIVIIINTAPQESYLNAFFFLFVKDYLSLFYPLEFCARHCEKVYRLCVIGSKSYKVWSCCITLQNSCFCESSLLFCFLLIFIFLLERQRKEALGRSCVSPHVPCHTFLLQMLAWKI